MKNDVASIFHEGKLQQIVKIISKNLLFVHFFRKRNEEKVEANELGKAME